MHVDTSNGTADSKARYCREEPLGRDVKSASKNVEGLDEMGLLTPMACC